MEPFDLLRYLAGVMDELGLRYFITGSTATIFYGEPRFTNDIDVVVDLSEPQIDEFCDRFPDADFYVSRTAAREAVRGKSQFNIIHPASGLKVDVIIPEAIRFNESRFARSKRVRAGNDFEVFLASPEDAIIKKLDFYRQGGSEKHLRDIAGVLNMSRDQLDLAYIAKWATEMGIGDLWSAVQERASGEN